MRTTQNTILITGGTSGIGLALAKEFYKQGNQVIIVARDMTKLHQLKMICPEAAIFQCDISQPNDLDALSVYIQNNYPQLNILINNAAIQYNYEFVSEPYSLIKIEQEISVNLTATIKLCAIFLPVILNNDFPAIVNVSSGLAIAPKKSAPVYCCTKAAIRSFTKTLRYQLEQTPVKVFEIIPALIDTPMTAGRGKRKMTAEALTKAFLADFSADRYESYIGKTRLLKVISRISPNLADLLLKDS
ncbi:SDR family oxidoreductase [Pedobacter nyackensis]|uniref:SDR family oxidoreductase n=1 Tax=Pedobacter nyackensis TaxID=475255 RepID=UPI00292FE0A3|nr:SDR family NAD(P)-dependent oxidoreductase [Pedobacter nyackensis]